MIDRIISTLLHINEKKGQSIDKTNLQCQCKFITAAISAFILVIF